MNNLSPRFTAHLVLQGLPAHQAHRTRWSALINLSESLGSLWAREAEAT